MYSVLKNEYINVENHMNFCNICYMFINIKSVQYVMLVCTDMHNGCRIDLCVNPIHTRIQSRLSIKSYNVIIVLCTFSCFLCHCNND